MPAPLVPNELSFGDIEAILAEIHNIASPKRSAFQARIKNFLRLGFPDYVARGRGRKGRYGAFELAAMAIAVELSQLGLVPMHVLKVMRDHWDIVCFAVRAAIEESREDQTKYVVATGEHPALLMFDPGALWPLMDDVRPNDVDYASASFELFHFGVASETVYERTSGHSFRSAIINVTALVKRLSLAFPEEGGMKEGFAQELYWETPSPESSYRPRSSDNATE